MKLYFFGTPPFARVILQGLSDAFPQAQLRVCTVESKPAGRGMKECLSPVGALAREKGLICDTPKSLRDPSFVDNFRAFAPDVAVVAAYGKLLPPPILSVPRYGCLNVHASLLPQYRGADPIRRAIWDGLDVTGISIMQMDEGLDTGPVLMRESLAIGKEDTFDTLCASLAALGARMAAESIRQVFAGTAVKQAQDDTRASYAKKLLRADEALDFTQSAAQLSRQVRALADAPLAFCTLPTGETLKLARVSVTDFPAGTPGTVRVQKPRVFVSCKDFELELLRVKPQAKGVMDAFSLVNGRKLCDGDILI